MLRRFVHRGASKPRSRSLVPAASGVQEPLLLTTCLQQSQQAFATATRVNLHLHHRHHCINDDSVLTPWPKSGSRLLLESLLDAKPHWKPLLEASIAAAHKEATDMRIIDELKDLVPNSLDAFLRLVDHLCAWIPTLYSNRNQAESKNIYYNLCSLYYAIDNEAGLELQKEDAFNDWMRFQANEWGQFCNTPASITEESLASFNDKLNQVNMDEYQTPPGGYLSFNQLFARDTKPGYRPVDYAAKDEWLTSPADCTFRARCSIDENGDVVECGTGEKRTCSVKGMKIGNIKGLLGDTGDEYWKEFVGGQFHHSFLGPADYHRFRVPARGVVKVCRKAGSRVYLQVNLKPVIVNGEQRAVFDAPDDCDSSPDGDMGYEFKQSRGVLIMDTPCGLIATVPIGMCQVSSVNMTAEPGVYLNKGDEFGYFMFGGSDMIQLFTKRCEFEPIEAYIGDGSNSQKHPPHLNACRATGTVRTVPNFDPFAGAPNPKVPGGWPKQ